MVKYGETFHGRHMTLACNTSCGEEEAWRLLIDLQFKIVDLETFHVTGQAWVQKKKM